MMERWRENRRPCLERASPLRAETCRYRIADRALSGADGRGICGQLACAGASANPVYERDTPGEQHYGMGGLSWTAMQF